MENKNSGDLKINSTPTYALTINNDKQELIFSIGYDGVINWRTPKRRNNNINWWKLKPIRNSFNCNNNRISQSWHRLELAG